MDAGMFLMQVGFSFLFAAAVFLLKLFDIWSNRRKHRWKVTRIPGNHDHVCYSHMQLYCRRFAKTDQPDWKIKNPFPGTVGVGCCWKPVSGSGSAGPAGIRLRRSACGNTRASFLKLSSSKWSELSCNHHAVIKTFGCLFFAVMI